MGIHQGLSAAKRLLPIIDEDNSDKNFDIYNDYKSQLKAYNKKLFDPFCRSEKISYTIPGTDDEISTTVAQLNFIKWCIKNKVIDYISNNKDTLFNKREK